MDRIAVVSDIHGNRTAFEAVLADLRQTSPDLIFHGGDLADGGSSPTGILDRIRDLGWPGVLGNADEMLFNPDSLTDFGRKSPTLASLFEVIGEIAAATREALGEQRLAWLRSLPRTLIHPPMGLVHATLETTWRAPGPDEGSVIFESLYSSMKQPVAIYGHLHRPFIRNLPRMIVANTGSVSLSYDGDRRASYLLLDDGIPTIRRVEWDLDRELKALSNSGFPHSDWTARMLQSSCFVMP